MEARCIWPGPCRREGSVFFDVFLGMLRFCVLLRNAWWWRVPEDGIRSAPSIPRLDDASSVAGRHVEVCLYWISMDLDSVPSNLWSLFIGDGCCSRVMVLGALARRLPVHLLQPALPRQVLPSSNEGGARTVARLRLVRVLVIVARWSKDLIVIFIILEISCTFVEVHE
jgi:hypothetical protein